MYRGKIKGEILHAVTRQFNAGLAAFPHSMQEYIDAGMTPRRFRWDVLWFSGGTGELYKHYNDNHIDNLLRYLTKEIGK